MHHIAVDCSSSIHLLTEVEKEQDSHHDLLGCWATGLRRVAWRVLVSEVGWTECERDVVVGCADFSADR